MFNNPFNSKIVSDISKFLNEHRNDIDIMPCLNEKAIAAAEKVAEQTVLEERKNVLVSLFNEAVHECGCRGTTKESNDFAKAVQMHIEAKKAVVPAGKVSNPSHKANELKKPQEVAAQTKSPASKSIPLNSGLASKGKNPAKIGENYELNEAFELPTEGELKKTIKQLETILKDKPGMKKMNVNPKEIQTRLNLMKGIHEFGKNFAKAKNKLSSQKDTKKEEVEQKFDLFLNLLEENELSAFGQIIEDIINDNQGNLQEINWNNYAK